MATLQDALISAAEKSGIADPEKLRNIKHAMEVRKAKKRTEEREQIKVDAVNRKIERLLSEDVIRRIIKEEVIL